MAPLNTVVVSMTRSTVTLAAACFLGGGTETLVVDREAYRQWLMREGMVQNLFPHLSAETRDLFFITGVCGPCYDKLWEEEE